MYKQAKKNALALVANFSLLLFTTTQANRILVLGFLILPAQTHQPLKIKRSNNVHSHGSGMSQRVNAVF